MENQTEKAFGLKTLITLLVGVISLVVVIPTISTVMNKNKVKETGWRIIINRDFIDNSDADFELETVSMNINKSSLVEDLFNESNSYSFNDNSIHVNENILSFTYKYDSYELEYSDFDKEGIYDFSNYILQDLNPGKPLIPTYTPW